MYLQKCYTVKWCNTNALKKYCKKLHLVKYCSCSKATIFANIAAGEERQQQKNEDVGPVMLHLSCRLWSIHFISYARLYKHLWKNSPTPPPHSWPFTHLLKEELYLYKTGSSVYSSRFLTLPKFLALLPPIAEPHEIYTTFKLNVNEGYVS